jgi:flagellar operon protein
MTDPIKVGNLFPGVVRPGVPAGEYGTRGTASGQSFQDVLNQKVLKFSHHAEVRLQQRGIRLQAEQLAKLESAIDQAAAKGAKDSLLLMNGMAFIVSVPNRTVVTAIDGASMRNNVFTQIDSAVIVQ